MSATSKTNVPVPPPQETATSVTEPVETEAEKTVALSADQATDSAHERVLRDIQVKTRACLSRTERERLKNYRIAWRKFWPLLPLFVMTWLIGMASLLPRFFRPQDIVVVATSVNDFEQLSAKLRSRLELVANADEAVNISPELAKLLAPLPRREALLTMWKRRLDAGVLPERMPDELADLTDGTIGALLVVSGNSLEDATFRRYSSNRLPPVISVAVLATATEYCEEIQFPELSEELAQLMGVVCQPSLQYSEELTHEYALRHPNKNIRVSTRAPMLGQEPAPHQIYRPQDEGWLKMSAKDFRHMLRNRSFYITALILLVFLASYSAIIYFTRLEYIVELRRFVLISLLLCLEFVAIAFCARFISTRHEVVLPLLLSCLPLAFFPAIICNLLNERLAVITATLMAMLLPLQLNLPSEHFPLFYFSLLVTLAAVPIFRQISRRLEFISRGLIFGVVLTVAELFFWLSETTMPSGKDLLIEIVFLLAAALANGMLNGCLCILCMSVLEVLFRLPTALSLTEVSNLDSPLMERLRQEAPGTYEHSVAVADLVVSGAHVIHANAKLAYAMALYHDIGKLYSPSHFTENLQDGETSPHLRHTPEDSCEYLREHARFGIRLARKYHLPSLIYPAILQHHGNTIMASFYNQACRQATEQGLPAPDQERFRYDQQTPASREVALIMLADSCEAATRSLTRPKRDCKGEAERLVGAMEELQKTQSNASSEEIATRYEQLLKDEEKAAQIDFRNQLTNRVRSVIQSKFTDGQFDQVELSTRQLAQLVDAFVATLLDKNHTRLEYKK
ncbi:MAG: HD domain-containing protein [Victivallales bacterium]|nr:HD domain-containing protein [Victivallales bacterium]